MTENQVVDFLAKKWFESGVYKGDVLLVQSSLLSILKKASDELDFKVTQLMVYDSLVKAVGENGTLIIPTFNFAFPKTKYFDIKTTKSRMGVLSEIARNDMNCVRTGHPIYSFAVRGKLAYHFENTDNRSGYGIDSPFALLKELKGKIAIIGLSDQHSMTSYHFVEECNQVDYRYFKDFEGEYIDKNGLSSIKTYSLFVRKIEDGVETDVNRAMDYLWDKGLYKGDKYNEGYEMRTIEFCDFFDAIDSIIKNGEAINYLYRIQK
jgi:aminoglycoside N3'-acetyltransferase